MLRTSDLERVETDYKKLIAMSKDRPFDQIMWNFKQWYVLNCTTHNVYMSGPNQVGGKTTTALQCILMWATGIYPPGYTGIRFDGPIEILVLCVTHEKTQEVITDRLFGRWDERGQGIVPSSWFDPDEDLTPAPGGKRGQISEATLPWHNEKGEPVGRSLIRFRCYRMGDEALQGSTPKVVICDEEPWPKAVFDELEARLNKTQGLLRIFANPTRGATECRKKFKSGDFRDYEYVQYSFEDCEHLTPEEHDYLDKKYPPGSAERELRLYGEVPEGEGLIFPVNDSVYSCEEIEVKPHMRAVVGLDLPHTANGASACARVSWDPNSDIVTVHGSWKKKGAQRAEFAQQIGRFGGHELPVAWPHDGGRADGTMTIIERFKHDFGLNFMKKHAQYRDGDKWSRAVKPIVDDIYDRMLTGRFRVVRGAANRELFEELRNYHSKDEKIARRQDDHIIDAVIKAIMVLPRVKEVAATIRGVGPARLPDLGRHRDFFSGRRAGSWKRRS